jgi:hypothetical protein
MAVGAVRIEPVSLEIFLLTGKITAICGIFGFGPRRFTGLRDDL